ncbi:MAG TPA: hypothetical protein PKY10_14710 [Lentisphaeria bacterium]|nr:hypothetical protein [Lentisphaeria bacterium]
MAETLGSLCDKLTIVKLKEYHSDDAARRQSLAAQATQLQLEIDDYLAAVASGHIAVTDLEFPANKVYREGIGQLRDCAGQLGEAIGQLATINCELWHEQEKVYDFEKVPVAEKDAVIKRLAILNLERNRCIDGINALLSAEVRKA